MSFAVRAGEIVTLAGLVGAGRSEVVSAIFGAEAYESGSVRLAGAELPRGDPNASMAAGVGYVPEDRRRQALVPAMSVRSNASLARLKDCSPGGVIDFAAEQRLVEEARRALSIRMASPDAAITTLSGGNQQKVVIARWLALRAQAADPRRADQGRRRRRQGGDQRDHRPSRGAGARDSPGQLRIAGSAGAQRPRAGDARRPHRRRTLRAPRSAPSAS